MYTHLPRKARSRYSEETAIFIFRGCNEVFLISVLNSLRPTVHPRKYVYRSLKDLAEELRAVLECKSFWRGFHLHLSCTFRRLGPTTGEFKQVYPQRCIGRVLWFSSKTRWEAIFRSTPGSSLIDISIGWPMKPPVKPPPRSSTSHRNFELSFIANNALFRGTKIAKICFVLRRWISQGRYSY